MASVVVCPDGECGWAAWETKGVGSTVGEALMVNEDRESTPVCADDNKIIPAVGAGSTIRTHCDSPSRTIGPSAPLSFDSVRQAWYDYKSAVRG